MKSIRMPSISRLSAFVGSKVRYDAASFFGATLCLLSLFVPWVLRPLQNWWHPPWGIYSRLPQQTSWSFLDLALDPDFAILMLLFIGGTVLAIFYRAGIVPQAVGLMGFIMTAPGHFTPTVMPATHLPRFDYYLGPGYFLALAGVLVSAFLVRNFWWQRSTSGVVPSISRIAALSPNSTRVHRIDGTHR